MSSVTSKQTNPNEDEDYKISESDRIKSDILSRLLARNLHLSNSELSVITGCSEEQISNIRSRQKEEESPPSSWDYVLAFDVGDIDAVRMPTRRDKKRFRSDEDIQENEEWDDGMSQTKYYGQIFNNIWERLRFSGLTVAPYKSIDNRFMYLVVGLSEAKLKQWAGERGTTLLLDPKGALEVGKQKRFGLAVRTTENTEDPYGDPYDIEYRIDISIWQDLHCQYSAYANPMIYRMYRRLPNQENLMTIFNERTRTSMIYELITAEQIEGGAEIDVHKSIKDPTHPLLAVFRATSGEDKLREFTQNWILNVSPNSYFWTPLQEIKDYFGEPTAFYFAFAQFYLKWLIVPSVIGSIYFIIQLYFGRIGVTSITFMPIMMILWSTAFRRYWLRAENAYCLSWGMLSFTPISIGVKDGEWMPDDVTGEWIMSMSSSRKFCRKLCTLSVIVLFLLLCTGLILAVLLIGDNDPNNNDLKIALGISNGIMIKIFSFSYRKFAKKINNWEFHETQQDVQNDYIYKWFFFEFINSFASLFYLAFFRAFYLGNDYYIRYYNSVCDGSNEYMTYYSQFSTDAPDIASPCNLNTCVDALDDDHWHSVITGYPLIASCYNDVSCCVASLSTDGTICAGICESVDAQNDVNETILSELRIQLASLFLTSLFIQNVIEIGRPLFLKYYQTYKRRKKMPDIDGVPTIDVRAELEINKTASKDTSDDVAEMIIQYGYVTLFVIALPVAPLLALINNIVEIRVDGFRIIKLAQRPNIFGSTGLGAWNDVLTFFSFVCVLTNVALISWRTELAIHLFGEDTAKKWMFFTSICLCLALLTTGVRAFIPTVSESVKNGIERQKYVEAVLVHGARVKDWEYEPPDDDDEFPFDPFMQFIDIEALDDTSKFDPSKVKVS